MAETRTDSELLADFASGDASAMEELVSRYRRTLYSWFVLQVGERGTAEDLYQDVWLKIIRGAAAFHDVSFKAWMWRIARNRLIDFRRKMRPELTLDQPVAGADGDADAPLNVDRVPDGRANVAEDMQSAERRRALRAAVAKLPEVHREIVVMRLVENLAFKDIAERLGISINTALGRMHDATDKLRRMLADG